MNQQKHIKQLEYLKRIDVMMALIGKCYPYSHMIRLATQQWGISERQAKRYIQRARENLKRIGTLPLSEQYDHVMSWMMSIYQDATQAQNHGLRRKVTRDMLVLLKQIKRDLSDEIFQEYQSRLAESGGLEEIIKALANEERDYPRQ